MRASSHRPLTVLALLATAALATAEVRAQTDRGADRASAAQVDPKANAGVRRTANRARTTTAELENESGSVGRWRLRVEDRRAVERAPAFGGMSPR